MGQGSQKTMATRVPTPPSLTRARVQVQAITEARKAREGIRRRRVHTQATPSSAGDSTPPRAATSRPQHAGTDTLAAGASTPRITATRRTTVQTPTLERFFNHVIEWSQ